MELKWITYLAQRKNIVVSNIQCRPSVGENDTYRITRIPSTVGGRGVVQIVGLEASTRIVYPGSGREDA